MATEERNLLGKNTATGERLTSILTTVVEADQIGLAYELLPGTRPADTGALVAIWQDADQIPWEVPPLRTQSIGTQQRGSLGFEDLTVGDNSYIIGLLVGPMKTDPQKARNAAASVFVPSPNEASRPRSSMLYLSYVGPTSVTVKVEALPGYRALTSLAWLGLWRGESASYNNPPDHAVQVKFDSNFGTTSFNNVSIGIRLTYTIGLFVSGWSSDPAARNQKALACSLTFTQGS
jgi:hypothetical protein